MRLVYTTKASVITVGILHWICKKCLRELTQCLILSYIIVKAFHLVFASPRGKAQSSLFYFILTQNLLRAERWAKEHGLPFPQIDWNPIFENSDIQECYVFEDQSDPECPTILHFALTNKTFRDFSAPGKKHYSCLLSFIYNWSHNSTSNRNAFL